MAVEHAERVNVFDGIDDRRDVAKAHDSGGISAGRGNVRGVRVERGRLKTRACVERGAGGSGGVGVGSGTGIAADYA